MRRRVKVAMTAAAAAIGVTGCATDPYGRSGDYAYGGSEWAGERQPYGGPLHGPGLDLLDPWLEETDEGRAVVTLGWQDAAEGYVSEEVAHRANIWFRRYADEDGDMTVTDPEIRTALVAAAGRHLER